MDTGTDESEAAFDTHVEAWVDVIGHADRAEPLMDYRLGLLTPVERKSVEPLAAVKAPSRVAAIAEVRQALCTPGGITTSNTY